jgi:hypothetical protein
MPFQGLHQVPFEIAEVNRIIQAPGDKQVGMIRESQLVDSRSVMPDFLL